MSHSKNHYTPPDSNEVFQRIDSKKAELQSESKFRTLVEKTKALIVVFQEQQICYVNPIAKVITGYSPAELKASSYFDQQFNLKSVREKCESNKIVHSNYQRIKIVTKDGKECLLDCYFEPINFDGKPATIVTAIDISKYINSENKILMALEKEREISQNLEKREILKQLYAAKFQNSQSDSETKSDSILPSNPQLKEVFDYIEAHYHESISLNDVALAVGYSPAYLTDLVKCQTGKTINRWIIKRRLAAAEQLLQKSNQSMEQIAEAVGYLNPGHFFRQFRQHYGTTPKVWRKANFSF